MGHAHAHKPTAQEVTIPSNSGWNKLYKVAGVVGIAGLAATFGIGLSDTHQLYYSYLTSYMYWLSIALGCLFFVIIQFASKAGWSVVLRRIAENYAATLPVLAILFIPILLGMHDLFHWTHEEAVANDPLLQSKAPYLNTTFFIVRAAIYLLVWTGLSMFFVRTSARQDQTGDPKLTYKMQWMSPLGIALFALSITFASFDWIMSLDPHWFSTMFGVYYFSGACLASYAIIAITGLALRKSGATGGAVNTEHLHDVGKFLFGFTIFWAYIAFSQYFLIWYANIPEETLWFEHRQQGGWMSLTYILVVGHFVIPFLFLMPRTIKRNATALGVSAVFLLAVHFVDLYWQIMPTAAGHGAEGGQHGPHFSILDLTAFVGIGGVFFAAFGWNLVRKATVPHRDPRQDESLAFQNF